MDVALILVDFVWKWKLLFDQCALRLMFQPTRELARGHHRNYFWVTKKTRQEQSPLAQQNSWAP